MKKIDINITESSKQVFEELYASKLILDFKGTTVNSSLVNTIRRLSNDWVPTYAFHTSHINITSNTSIYDNDYMRLRISQIVIKDISNDIYYLEDKYWKDVDYFSPDRPKHPKDDKVCEFYINATNDTNEVKSITTKDVKLYEDGEELVNKFDNKYPSLILHLRPGESFNCRCVAALGIGKVDSIWMASGNTFFTEVNDNTFELTLESQGQYDEYEILHKSCQILKEKINLTKTLVDDQFLNTKNKTNKTDNTIKIILINEDHTLGAVINEYLQDHPDTLFAGLSKPNLLIDEMIIEFSTKKNKDPQKVFTETLEYVIKIFDNIQLQIEKLGKKFIKYKI